VELTAAKSRVVADGFRRWTVARNEKVRAEMRQQMNGQHPVGALGKIRNWFRTERVVLRDGKTEEKSSPNILW
jgi:hypothetical protein